MNHVRLCKPHDVLIDCLLLTTDEFVIQSNLRLTFVRVVSSLTKIDIFCFSSFSLSLKSKSEECFLFRSNHFHINDVEEKKKKCEEFFLHQKEGKAFAK